MKTFSIGKISNLTGLTHRTLHHYENIGLIKPERSSSDYRVYTEDDVQSLYKITALKTLGLSLSAIKKLKQSSFEETDVIISQHLECLKAQQLKLFVSVNSLQNLLQGGVTLEGLLAAIRREEQRMSPSTLVQFYDKHYSDTEQDAWAQAKASIENVFGPGVYDELWRRLNERILESLPLDVSSALARQYLHEWNILLRPILHLMGKNQLQKSAKLTTQSFESGTAAPFEVPERVWKFITQVSDAQVPETNKPIGDVDENRK